METDHVATRLAPSPKSIGQPENVLVIPTSERSEQGGICFLRRVSPKSARITPAATIRIRPQPHPRREGSVSGHDFSRAIGAKGIGASAPARERNPPTSGEAKYTNLQPRSGARIQPTAQAVGNGKKTSQPRRGERKRQYTCPQAGRMKNATAAQRHGKAPARQCRERRKYT